MPKQEVTKIKLPEGWDAFVESNQETRGHRTPFSQEEDAVIIRGRQAGLSVAKLALALKKFFGRTVGYQIVRRRVIELEAP